MIRPIKTLPLVERWDCAGCGNCCRGSIIQLYEDDLVKLRRQNWEKHSDLRRVQTIVRSGWFGKRYQLARREDGSCVFLMEDNRCRIHAEYGGDAKPLVCRMFPLQLVPHEKHAVLTLRRSCPAAAADQGRELSQHRAAAKRLAQQGNLLEKAVRAPAVTPRYRGSWDEAMQASAELDRLLTDDRYPLVRRLVHGVRFCSLLDECRLKRLAPDQFEELLPILGASSREGVSELFRDRQPPRPATAALFRQIAAEYLRLHSRHRAIETWRERWRMTRVAVAFARGSGPAPRLVACLPEATFADLEQPLGPLAERVQQPIVRYYEVNAASLQYVIASRPDWSVTESFRALALAYPVGLWLLRWCAHGRQPTREDAIEIVTIADRGQGHQPLVNAHHRRRIALLAQTDELPRLIAWHAR